MSDPKYTNQLIHEKSPYLLQHAHNPVNWYPWGDEAFALAKKDNKPVLVSIGYATCTGATSWNGNRLKIRNWRNS